MSRKYLVTGAAGFLGSTVCRQLVEEGADVRAFVLPNDPAANPGVRGSRRRRSV